MMNPPILVDGPNYVNRILDIGIGASHVARQLSLAALRDAINKDLPDIISTGEHADTVEFICSKRRFGPTKAKLTDDQQNTLLDRLRAERGVFVDVVDIPGDSEKGVDQTISGRLEEYSVAAPALVLVSADRDFIPTLKKLRHKAKIILVAVNRPFPTELQNEGYATIDLHQRYNELFVYHYPEYAIEDLGACPSNHRLFSRQSRRSCASITHGKNLS